MKKRWENPRAVEIELDANSKPVIYIWDADGGAETILIEPRVDVSFITAPKNPEPPRLPHRLVGTAAGARVSRNGEEADDGR